MTANETAIIFFFRRYQMRASEMLFCNPADCKVSPGPFNTAVESLMRQGFLIKERPKHAYSLTKHGYALSRTLKVEQPHRSERQRSCSK